MYYNTQVSVSHVTEMTTELTVYKDIIYKIFIDFVAYKCVTDGRAGNTIAYFLDVATWIGGLSPGMMRGEHIFKQKQRKHDKCCTRGLFK
ncbi:hypothetical protein XELAEV_18022070mg [Xenopus laevis]|uniref:Uncharacterized protein n=1 Tax=Xenopus laevis TaxID=8355 RepID=A0A974D425_XENLA|nr:hypothetical protein XELAEV_18022070mg [Xenopus laevis]